MAEAKELDQHVNVERLPHLWLDGSEVCTDVAINTRSLKGRNAIQSLSRDVGAMEKSADDKAHRPMKDTSRHERVSLNH